MIDPIPGFISGVAVKVGKVFSVGVADGGNQIMVAVGSGVSEGMDVSVDGMVVAGGRQAPRNNVIAMRTIFSMTCDRKGKQSPNRIRDCFVADASRNDGLGLFCMR